jgi:hypothetical protein
MGTKRHFRTWALAATGTILLTCPGLTFARILYVDDDAPGPGNGSSWATAFKYLQDALVFAKAGDEIRIGQGQYRPDLALCCWAAPGSRQETFLLVDGVTILGGFAGLAAADPDLRDTTRFATILTGDLAGNDDSTEGTRFLDNSFHVVTAKKTSNVSHGAVLDGLTITHGYYYDSGGNGLRNQGAGVVVRDCTFLSNRTGDGNGGAINNSAGHLRLENCRFLNNYGGEGAGALCSWGGSAEVINCEFIGNRGAEGAGTVEISGGIFFHCLFRGNSAWDGTGGIASSGALSLLYCTFVDNDGDEHTGALSIDGSAVVAHCLFCGNTGDETGAIYVGSTSVRLEQCTFYANVSTDGDVGAVYCRPASSWADSVIPAGSFQARGCIFWANGVWRENEDGEDELMTEYADQISGDPNLVTVEYCCIEGWTPQRGGTGNIGADPLFVAPDQNDFHLKSQAGHWDAASLAWVLDSVTSPCIDAGDPNTPVGQEPSPNGGRVNMGVYGGTCEASKSWFGAEPSGVINAADLNGDGQVDAEDYRLALQRWPQVDQ